MSYRGSCAVIILCCAYSISCSDHAIAANDWDDEKPSRGTVNNYNLFGKKNGRRDSKINYMHAEMATRIEDTSRAIILGRKAVKLDPDDIDARVALGEALFQKIEEQQSKDPKLFNECVKTWLVVHRNIVGDEQAMTYKGFSIPGVMKFFEDEDRGVLSKDRLIALCGRAPKMFESNQRYLNQVLMPEKSVSGQIISTNTKSTSEKTRRKQKDLTDMDFE